jgi:hypothetical protein
LKRRIARGRARRIALAAASGALALLSSLAHSGHESPFYPSFYPQEIRLEVLAPNAAASGWAKPRVHAYAGGGLFADGAAPADSGAVTSLRSFLVLSFDATAGRYAQDRAGASARCAAADRVLPLLARSSDGYAFHPFPITPYHADYLGQADRAERARSRYAGSTAARDAPIRLRALGPLAQALVPEQLRAGASGWDATVEEVELERLLPPVPQGLLSAPPWIKQGWFQAYQLYPRTARTRAAGDYRRLVTGEYSGDAQRIDLERALVSALGSGCERVVAGYTLRKEYFNSEYSVGIENVGADSQAGLTSAIFPRTVKLKDFPWNGWLRVGTAAAPEAAWNPVAGLSDRFGQLLWAATGDPGLLPEPYAGSWIANRAEISSELGGDSLRIPADAVRPELGTGALRPVGPGRTARLRLRYSLVSSPFHDGSAPGIADVLYPYIFAFRWTAASGPGPRVDPEVARSTAQTREWLLGFRVVDTETRTRNFGADLVFSYRVPVIDVFLDHRSNDPKLAAAAAPPWSTLPWPVIVLMEEAVSRGVAAFSHAEAQRRGLPWLDLVRDKDTGARLAALVEAFRRDGYRPEPLKPLVSAEEARQRWAALAAFHDRYGHFLVTNGPYRLDAWSADSATLAVFRDLGYPQGVGTFDAYAIPLRGYATAVEDRGDRIEIGAEVERVVHTQRSYEIERVGLAGALSQLDEEERPVCAYVLLDSAGKVLQARSIGPDADGQFRVDLSGLRAPGMYTVAAAVLVGGNRMNPEVRLIEHRVGAIKGGAVRATEQHR